MGNTYTTPPTLPDTGDLIAGKTIKTQTIERMGDLSNYLHANGGTSTCLSQAFDRNTCVTNSTSFVELCRWRIPIPSNNHTTIDFHVNAQVTTTGTGKIEFSLTDGNSVSQGSSTITLTSTSMALATVSHTFSSATTSSYVDILMKGKVDSAAYDLDIQIVAARFLPLSSPLSAGAAAQGTDTVTPFGVGRLAANYPLTSRAGVQWRKNIETMRKRKRPLLSWSGIMNPSSAFTGRGKGPKSLGVGDVETMQIQGPLFVGGGDLTLWVYVESISGSKNFAFMGRIFTVSSNGWNEYTFSPDLSNVSEQSSSFGISLYKIYPSSYNQSDTLLDNLDRTAAISSLPRITALSLWSN
tara:strand:- start:5475 stop:6536 length:1062 start_codon:yes stop_codon:yes gene_type:complete